MWTFVVSRPGAGLGSWTEIVKLTVNGQTAGVNGHSLKPVFGSHEVRQVELLASSWQKPKERVGQAS